MSDADSFESILKALTAIFGFAGAYFAWRSQMRKQLITRLEDEIAELKKSIQRYTSRVDPESDRKLIKTAKRSIEVLGINCLRVLTQPRPKGVTQVTFDSRRLSSVIVMGSALAQRSAKCL